MLGEAKDKNVVPSAERERETRAFANLTLKGPAIRYNYIYNLQIRGDYKENLVLKFIFFVIFYSIFK